MSEVSKPHSELVAMVRDALDGTRCIDPTWEREDCPMVSCVCAESDKYVAAFDDLVEQLEAAQAEAELKRIETHHANAKRAAIEEQLDTAHARGYREGVRNEHARTKEQLEAQEDALAWGETMLARHDAFLQQQTPQIAYAMKDAADGFRDALAKLHGSNPASEPKEV